MKNSLIAVLVFALSLSVFSQIPVGEFREHLPFRSFFHVAVSPDIIYANAVYNTFYGLLGTTVLAFSDVLGNHRIIAQTSLQIDLKKQL